MSARSLWLACAFTLVALGTWFASPLPVFANACSFACTATFIAPGAEGSLTSCTTDQQCQDFCATTCGRLSSPVAYVDRAHPSTCGTGTPRACTSCSCTPNARIACEGTAPTAVCTRGCTDTCNVYNEHRPAGVSGIACATTPPATCAVPPATPPATQGFCHFNCSFGATRPVRTSVSCTVSSPSECSTSNTALRTACTSLGLEPATRIECRPGDDGPKCVVECIRPTAVSETDRGTCSASPESRAGLDICGDRCREVCGRRGMACANDNPPCTSGHCEFSCTVLTAPTQHDDRATVCTATGGAATCGDRCAAFCRERGGLCGEPAPTCQMPDSTASGATDPSAPGSSGSSRSSGRARTAPTFRVTFPDPFDGRLTLQEIIGSIIRILVGLCGVFFLGVFVYGGLLYLTSAGHPEAVQRGQAALVNAVIGLVIVLVAYIAVALVVQVSDQLQTGEIGNVDQSQNALDDDPTALRPGGTTQATGRSSQGGSGAGTGSGAPAASGSTGGGAQTGTPTAACRSYFRADPATCSSGSGPCPRGATDLGKLLTVWRSRFPAPSPELRDPTAACRTCLESTIQSMRGQYPGIDTTCMPALVNLWSTTCSGTCNAFTATPRNERVESATSQSVVREEFCSSFDREVITLESPRDDCRICSNACLNEMCRGTLPAGITGSLLPLDTIAQQAAARTRCEAGPCSTQCRRR